jgi:hypothetical protein
MTGRTHPNTAVAAEGRIFCNFISLLRTFLRVFCYEQKGFKHLTKFFFNHTQLYHSKIPEAKKIKRAAMLIDRWCGFRFFTILFSSHQNIQEIEIQLY